MGETNKAYFLGELPLQNPSNSSRTLGPVQLESIAIEAFSSMKETDLVTDVDGNNGFEANPHEAWLPITESRNGNTYTAVFHLLSSGIGIQALLLPVALATLGWSWGIICFSIAFMWQLYTAWLLVQLHESVPGTRYSRYLQLAIAAFGPKLGKLLAIFPVMYLSGGTCVMLIITGGGTLELLFKMMCEGGSICDAKPLTGAEWFLVFIIVAIGVAQRPNLNSVAGISFIGAITAIGYCTFIWVLSISEGRPSDVSYDHSSLHGKSDMDRMSGILNALGIIALAFRGHNLVLEIQGTLPTSSKIPSKKPMWKAVTVAYIMIAMCIFPLAIAGFWAYGNKVPFNGGLLSAFSQFHGPSTSKLLKGLTYLLVVTNCLSSFQIYAMVVFDNLEFRYVSMKKKQCPWWIRSGFRLFFGGLAFLISVAFPFLPSLAPLIGGITLPLTLAYPCFMWISIKEPRTGGYSVRWCLNLGLGCLGMVLSVLLVVAAVWSLATQGLHANFFKPQ